MLWSCLATGSPEGSVWDGGHISALAAQLLGGEMGPISPGQASNPRVPKSLED